MPREINPGMPLPEGDDIPTEIDTGQGVVKVPKEPIDWGKRGVIFKSALNQLSVAIKVKRKDSESSQSIKREADALQLLNKYSIGPTLRFANDNCLIIDWIDGVRLDHFLQDHPTQSIDVIFNALEQCRQLDTLNLNKEEMTRPYRHIIVDPQTLSVTFIDFERTHKVDKPANITQFLQFISSGRVLEWLSLDIDKEKIIEISKAYIADMSDELYRDLVATLRTLYQK